MRSIDTSTRTVVLVQALRWVRATVQMLLSFAILAPAGCAHDGRIAGMSYRCGRAKADCRY